MSFLCLNSTDNDVLSRLSTLIHCRFPVLCSHTPQSCHRFEIYVSFMTPPIPVDGSYTPCLSCVAISFVFLVFGQSPSPDCLRCPYLVVMSSLLFPHALVLSACCPDLCIPPSTGSSGFRVVLVLTSDSPSFRVPTFFFLPFLPPRLEAEARPAQYVFHSLTIQLFSFYL